MGGWCPARRPTARRLAQLCPATNTLPGLSPPAGHARGAAVAAVPTHPPPAATQLPALPAAAGAVAASDACLAASRRICAVVAGRSCREGSAFAREAFSQKSLCVCTHVTTTWQHPPARHTQHPPDDPPPPPPFPLQADTVMTGLGEEHTVGDNMYAEQRCFEAHQGGTQAVGSAPHPHPAAADVDQRRPASQVGAAAPRAGSSDGWPARAHPCTARPAAGSRPPAARHGPQGWAERRGARRAGRPWVRQGQRGPRGGKGVLAAATT